MTILRNIAFATVARRLRWIEHLNDIAEGTPATPIAGRSALIPLGENGGAILFWTFDLDEDGQASVMLARLTEDEAEAVYTADPLTTGMLEPVRRLMKHRCAVVGQQSPTGHISAQIYFVPRSYSEEEFVSEISDLAREPRAGIRESVMIPRSVPVALSFA